VELQGAVANGFDLTTQPLARDELNPVELSLVGCGRGPCRVLGARQPDPAAQKEEGHRSRPQDRHYPCSFSPLSLTSPASPRTPAMAGRLIANRAPSNGNMDDVPCAANIWPRDGKVCRSHR